MTEQKEIQRNYYIVFHLAIKWYCEVYGDGHFIGSTVAGKNYYPP
jgi:hypothetical protein